MDVLNLQAVLSLATDNFENGLREAESKANSFGSKFGSAVKTVAKVGTAAMGVASAAVVKMTKDAVDSYADYEQLVGGVETLFGSSAKKVLADADNAYKSAGMSANEYMETSIQSAAALINSLGGDQEKAADLMDMSITDMSDNVNKMGTSMEAVQNAYRGFSRGNFTMLDNLALGFAGTKDGMQELLDKAGEISGFEYDISSYSDIVEAIHVVQDEMGITGTTAKEASETISGSLASTRSAWANLMTAFGRGNKETKNATKQFVKSLATTVKNIIPIVTQALGGIVEFVKEAGPAIASELPTLVSDLLPKVLSAAASLVKGLIVAIPSFFSGLVGALSSVGTQIVEYFRGIADYAVGAFDSLVERVLAIDWGNIGRTIYDLITGALGAIVGWVTTLYQAAAEKIQSVDWSAVGQQIWELIKSAFANVVDFFRNSFDSAKEGVKNIDWIALGTAIWNYIVSVFMAIGTIFKELFEGAKTEIQNIDWLAVGTTIWNAITGMLAEIGNYLWSLFTVAAGLIKQVDWLQLGKDIWNWIITGIGNVAEVLKAIFNFAVAQIKTINWTQLGKDIWNWIVTGLGKVAEVLKAIFNFAVAQIKTINWLQLGKDIWNWIIDAFAKIGETYKALFNFAVERIKEIDWEQLGKDIWGWIKSAFSDAVTGVSAFLKDKFNDAIDAVKEIDWLQFGKDILQKIKDAFVGIGDYFAGLFDFTGIHIKMPHFTPHYWTMPGFNIQVPYWWSIDWYKKAYNQPVMFKSPTVIPTMDGLKGFGDGVGGEVVLSERKLKEIAGGGGNRTNNVTINVYQQPGEDSEELARRINELISKDYDREEAVFA